MFTAQRPSAPYTPGGPTRPAAGSRGLGDLMATLPDVPLEDQGFVLFTGKGRPRRNPPTGPQPDPRTHGPTAWCRDHDGGQGAWVSADRFWHDKYQPGGLMAVCKACRGAKGDAPARRRTGGRTAPTAAEAAEAALGVQVAQGVQAGALTSAETALAGRLETVLADSLADRLAGVLGEHSARLGDQMAAALQAQIFAPWSATVDRVVALSQPPTWAPVGPATHLTDWLTAEPHARFLQVGAILVEDAGSRDAPGYYLHASPSATISMPAGRVGADVVALIVHLMASVLSPGAEVSVDEITGVAYN